MMWILADRELFFKQSFLFFLHTLWHTSKDINNCIFKENILETSSLCHNHLWWVYHLWWYSGLEYVCKSCTYFCSLSNRYSWNYIAIKNMWSQRRVWKCNRSVDNVTNTWKLMTNATEHRGRCPASSGKIPLEIVFLSMWLLGITNKITAEYFVYWNGKKLQ